VLIRIDVKAGMALGNHWQRLSENVDIQAFTLYNMGFNYQKLNNLDFIWS
jgi:hypothetical protein